MNPSICFEMLYPELQSEEKIPRIASRGFSYVEFWSWRDKNIGAIRSACETNGVGISNFSGQRRGDLIDDATHNLIEEDLISSVSAAKQLGNSILMVLTNELGEEGIVVHPLDRMPESEKRNNCIAGLRRLLKLLPEDMTLVLEPLNTRLDHVGYFLPDLETARGIIQEVDDTRLKILCDFYHQGMMGDDPLELIDRYGDMIGYVHIADYPGRHEPLGDSRRWTTVLDRLGSRGYDGFIGFEFAPTGDSDRALDEINALWRSVT